jgi:G3E family GTPase
MPVPVYVISGFLGAGKSTFINHLLDTAPAHLRILVLVNEFGSLTIDKKIIKTDPLNIVDLSGGCICCGLFAELMASLRFALDDFKAHVILIESTGLAVPQEIARQALTPAFEGRLEFGGIITLVDATGVLSDEYPMVKQQVKDANVVILNKIDLVEGHRLMALHRELSHLMPAGSRLLTASFGQVDYGQVIGRLYDHGHLSLKYKSPPPAPLNSTAGFATICLVRHSAAPRDQILHFYQEHDGQIIRSKGFVLTDKGAVQLQFCQAGLELKDVHESIRRTELVLIVREEHLDLLERELKEVFDEAANGGMR